jgi:hypothetical protein
MRHLQSEIFEKARTNKTTAATVHAEMKKNRRKANPMNFKTKIVSIIGAGMILFGSATGVAAQEKAPAGTNASVKVEVDGGAIGIESVQQSKQFDTVKVNQDFTTGSTTQGAVAFLVRDARFTREGWSVNILASDFTYKSETGSYTVPVSNLSVTGITVTKQAGDDGAVAAATPLAMSAGVSKMVASAAKGKGSGIYKVEVGTTLTIPANTTIGTYTSTITFNLASAP